MCRRFLGRRPQPARWPDRVMSGSGRAQLARSPQGHRPWVPAAGATVTLDELRKAPTNGVAGEGAADRHYRSAGVFWILLHVGGICVLLKAGADAEKLRRWGNSPCSCSASPGPSPGSPSPYRRLRLTAGHDLVNH